MSDFAKDTNVPTNDCISRQSAIDIERNATVDTNPSHFEAHQKFTQFMDDAEISSFGRWQWSNGFNTALTAVGIDLKKLPSAEPKKGQWEEKSVFEGEIQEWQSARCSVCNKYHTTPYLYYFDNFNYCPNCGAKMEVDE